MKKGQSLIIQFALFFLLGFSLFITIGSFFKSQSESFRSESIEYNTKLANSYLSAFAIVLVDNCKNCDQASVLIKLENTTAGYFFEEKLSSLGLNISAPGTPQSFTSSVHNLNCSTDFAGRASSAKPIYLTFNRSQNVLYLGELGITPSSTTTTSLPTTTASPLWQNQGTNDTDNSILQGQAINLTAQGKDDTALDWAWLSTNETGQWRNITFPSQINQSWANLTGLIGLWHLNSVNSSNYTSDSSGYNKDGKLVNYPCSPATCNLTAGKFGNALDFDGSNDYVTVSNPTTTGNSFTVTAWVNFRNLANRFYLIDSGNSSLNAKNFYIWRATADGQSVSCPANTLVGGFKGSSSWRDFCVNISIFNTDVWYFLAMTYDGNTFRFYVNDIIRNQTSVTDTVVVPSPGNLTIGSFINQTVLFFNGTIDEVAIWNRSLSTEEIYELYTKTYNSPMNMTKNSNWQWSNFTWSNSSISAVTTVAWRIYYNDTSGNENATDVMSFTVG